MIGNAIVVFDDVEITEIYSKKIYEHLKSNFNWRCVVNEKKHSIIIQIANNNIPMNANI